MNTTQSAAWLLGLVLLLATSLCHATPSSHPSLMPSASPLASKTSSQTTLCRDACRPRKAWPRDSGLFEFVTFSTIHGMAFGALIPHIVSGGSRNGGINTLGLLLGGAAGFTGSLLGGLRWRPDAGQASSVITGTMLGAWNFFFLNLALNSRSSQANIGLDSFGLMGLGVLGSVLGYTSSIIFGHLVKPTIHRSMFASSFGFWFAAILACINFAAFLNTGNQETRFGLTMLFSANIGLIAGALLFPTLRFSYARMLRINLGGFGGAALAAFLSGLLFPGAIFVALPIGAILGITFSHIFTYKMRAVPPYTPRQTPSKTARWRTLAAGRDETLPYNAPNSLLRGQW